MIFATDKLWTGEVFLVMDITMTEKLSDKTGLMSAKKRRVGFMTVSNVVRSYRGGFCLSLEHKHLC